MSRYGVRIGSALALLAALVFTLSPARADDRLALHLDGKTIVLTHVRAQEGGRAVAVDDPGVRALFDRIGAALTWQPGERYILVTTAEPVVISFSLGDTRYDVGPIKQNAPFAPFLLDGHPYVPLDELIHALDFAIKSNGPDLVLQPQLASLDVQSVNGTAKLVAHAGMPLDGRILSDSADKIVIAFDGVGSMLPSSRTAGGPVQRIDVKTLGTVTHPQTQVTLYLAPGAAHGAPATDDQRDFTIAFTGANAPSQPVAQAQQPDTSDQPEPAETAPPSPAASPEVTGPVQVTAVQTQPQNGAMVIRVSVNGSAAYDWHRLRAPDNRFWLDLHNARLAIPPSDQPGSDPVTAVRVHQQSPDTVRVALSLSAFDTLDVTPSADGVTITVSNTVADEGSVPHSGAGNVGDNAVAQTSPPPADTPWKFSPRAPEQQYTAANPRLIVLDPGHGGSDAGSMHGGLVEKELNLQIAQRLRTILVARGWQVMMTRETDRDVYAPNDSASDELQARDDVANHNGARLFVSIHANAFMNAGPHGATVYYYKGNDLALAQAVDKRIGSELAEKNNGTVKDKLYVVHHANMPATLIETAFLTNPDDRVLMTDPHWQQQMAQAIADGIQDYAGAPPPASSTSGQ